jgi:hypothetical protein
LVPVGAYDWPDFGKKGKGRKVCFFEKKQQKTFVRLPRTSPEARAK